MTREELIELVIQIMDVENNTEVEIDRLLDELKVNVPHPSPANLIYHEELTPEEIVDQALSYKPIQL